MVLLTELVNDVSNVKTNIKQAIRNKGIVVTDNTPFNEYPSKIDSIQSAMNPQNKTVYSGGVITYDTGTKTFYAYSTSDIPQSSFHAIGEAVWVESTATPHNNYIAYDSKYENEQLVPDFSKPVSIVLDLGTNNLSVYLKVYEKYGTYIPKLENEYVLECNYDSLNSVNIDYTAMKALGVENDSNIHITTPMTAGYSFIQDNAIRTIVCDSSEIGQGAFNQMNNLNSITLTNYKGSSPTIDERGFYSFNDSYNQIVNQCTSLSTMNLPELVAFSSNFASDTYNSNESGYLTINAPKLQGVLGTYFIGSQWSGEKNKPYNILKYNHIDFRLFKYISNTQGDILTYYINDPDNNITDTLTFPNVEYLGSQCFAGNYIAADFSAITTLNLPKLVCMAEYARLDQNHIFGITSLDLPSIQFIGNESFGDKCGITTFNIGSDCKYIESHAFEGVDGAVINIDLPEPDFPTGDWRDNTPWGAANTTVNWTGQE